METYFSIVFKHTRRKLGCNHEEFARLLEIDVSQLILIEEYQLFPDSETLYRLDKLELQDRGILSLM
jgi:ribosome-binding protein aMBF1 (putative translation factor)